MKEPQTLPITVVFKVEHSPDTPEHLQMVLKSYLEGKGIKLNGLTVEV